MLESIHQEIDFKANPKTIYAAMMDSRKHGAFTGNKAAKISKKIGGAFSAHGGYVSGFNLDLVENKRIVQAWRAKNWPKGVFSIVTFTLERQGSGTRLTMDHNNIPEGESGHLDPGWHKSYWKPLAEYLKPA